MSSKKYLMSSKKYFLLSNTIICSGAAINNLCEVSLKILLTILYCCFKHVSQQVDREERPDVDKVSEPVYNLHLGVT